MSNCAKINKKKVTGSVSKFYQKKFVHTHNAHQTWWSFRILGRHEDAQPSHLPGRTYTLHMAGIEYRPSRSLITKHFMAVSLFLIMVVSEAIYVKNIIVIFMEVICA